MGTLTQNLERQRGKCHRQGRTSDGHTFIIYYVLCIYYDGHYFMSWERGSDRMGRPFLVISLWLCDMTDRVQCKWLSFNPSSVEALSFFVPQSEGLDSADCRLESNIPLSFGTHLYYIPAFPRLSRQNTNNKKCWHITSRMLYIYLIYLCIISSASRDFLNMVYLLFEFRWI